MPDGWEVHFGLDPLNRSNALLDDDRDGWDLNRDGLVSADVSRTDTAIALGESLSNLEEYYTPTTKAIQCGRVFVRFN